MSKISKKTQQIRKAVGRVMLPPNKVVIPKTAYVRHRIVKIERSDDD